MPFYHLPHSISILWFTEVGTVCLGPKSSSQGCFLAEGTLQKDKLVMGGSAFHVSSLNKEMHSGPSNGASTALLPLGGKKRTCFLAQGNFNAM